MIRVGLAAVLLAMAALFALRYYDPSQVETTAAPDTPPGSDYYLLDAEIRQMDANGDLQYRIQADESLHFPDESVQLDTIEVAYLADGGPPWRLTAPQGRVPPGSRDIRLDGGVTALRDSGTGDRLRVTTPYVWIRPEADRVETDAAVTAEAPGRRVRATGMTALLEERLLRLHHDVRVTYAP